MARLAGRRGALRRAPASPGAGARRDLVLALAGAPAASAAGEVDASFGQGGLAPAPFGIGARAAGLALAPDGRIVVAGDQRGSGGEGALTARFPATGVLDGSFAGTARRVDRFGTGATPQRAGAVAVQADGATVIAGVAGDQWSLARLLPSGQTDGLFGAAGVTLRDPAPGGEPPDEFYPDEEPALPDGTGPAAIALTPAGQIVAAGSAGVHNDDGVPGEQIVVARFSDRGVPDPAFGRDGFAVLQLGFGSSIRHASSVAKALTLLPDGRIAIAGRASARDSGDRAFVARLNANGTLDRGFARQGRLLVQLGRSSAARVASSSLAALVQRPDGRLLASGRATDVAGNHQVLLAQFTAAGLLDPARGRGVVSQLGIATSGAAPLSLSRGLALRPDGSVAVAGAATSGARRGATLAARYRPNGTLDCGYGARGRALAFGGRDFDLAQDGAFATLEQGDRGLLVAGRRAGGGLLLGRLTGGSSSAPAAAARPRLVTLAPRYTGRGRGYAYGLVDGSCAPASVRFTIAPPAGRSVSTRVQRVAGRFGPQVVCAPLTNLRPDARYRIRITTAPAGGARGARGAERVLRAARTSRRKAPVQEGCA